MKVKYSLFLIFLFLSTSIVAQSNFQKIIPTQYHGSIISMTKTLDGGYIYTGDYNSSVVKLDSSFNVEWSKVFTAPFKTGHGISQGKDSSYFIYSGNDNNLGAGVFRISSTGNLIWAKSFGEGMFRKPLPTDDNGCVVLSDDLAEIHKVDSAGNYVWATGFTYPGVNPRGAYINYTSDGGYVLLSYLDNIQTQGDMLIMKLDSLGNITWSKLIETMGQEGGRCVKQTSDGGYIICGGNITNLGVVRGLVVKVNALGNYQWSSFFRGHWHTDIYDIVETGNGFIAVGGVIDTFSISTTSYAVKLNTSGQVVWMKSYSNDESMFYQVLKKSANEFMLAGHKRVQSYLDAWIVQIDSNGYNSCFETIPNGITYFQFVSAVSKPITQTGSGGVPSSYTPGVLTPGIFATQVCVVSVGEIESSHISIYPNPVTTTFTLEFTSEKLIHQLKTNIFSVDGRLIYEIDDLSTANNIINVETWPKGIYILELIADENRILEKIVVQ